MTIPILSEIDICVPSNIQDQLTNLVNPTYVADYRTAYNNFVGSDVADYYVIDTAYKKVVANDAYGLQEDFNFLDNKLWNVKKLQSTHPTSVSLTPPDPTLGNRMVGFPLLFINKSSATKTFKISLSHSLSMEVEYDSTISTNKALFNIISLSPALGRQDEEGNYDYQVFGAGSDFLTFPTTAINNRVVLVGGTDVGTNNIPGHPDKPTATSLTSSNTKLAYAKITDIGTTDITLEFYDSTYTTLTTVPASPLDYTFFIPANQEFQVLGLGKLKFSTDKPDTAYYFYGDVDFNISPSQYGIAAWMYGYKYGQKKIVFEDISITLEAGQAYLMNVTIIRKPDASIFSNGLAMGITSV